MFLATFLHLLFQEFEPKLGLMIIGSLHCVSVTELFQYHHLMAMLRAFQQKYLINCCCVTIILIVIPLSYKLQKTLKPDGQTPREHDEV